jgi:hypothetical protein
MRPSLKKWAGSIVEYLGGSVFNEGINFLPEIININDIAAKRFQNSVA